MSDERPICVWRKDDEEFGAGNYSCQCEGSGIKRCYWYGPGSNPNLCGCFASSQEEVIAYKLMGQIHQIDETYCAHYADGYCTDEGRCPTPHHRPLCNNPCEEFTRRKAESGE